MKVKATIFFMAVGILVAGVVRWTQFSLNRLLVRTIVVTNYVNPESVKVTHLYHTNIIGCVSTGYQHWTFVITNQTDEYDVQMAR